MASKFDNSAVKAQAKSASSGATTATPANLNAGYSSGSNYGGTTVDGKYGGSHYSGSFAESSSGSSNDAASWADPKTYSTTDYGGKTTGPGDALTNGATNGAGLSAKAEGGTDAAKVPGNETGVGDGSDYVGWWESPNDSGGSYGGTNQDTANTGAAEEGPNVLEENAPSPYKLPEVEGPNPERIEHVDTEALKDLLQQIVDSQQQQTEQRTNYTVEQGVKELTRALEDAAKSYQTQRDQVSADEANALDNQALYAEARGDRGGIGAAQYAAIQNTAAQNRRAVNDAQVKLGTDTARQIEDLRAQGEFEKADQLLSLTQSHLAQLMSLEQWALESNLSVDEFNSQLQQWVDEYNMSKQKYLSDLELASAQLTGVFGDGTRTYEAQQALISSLANSGNTLLSAGIMPSRQQLEAMGLTEAQAKEYMQKKGLYYG